MLGPAIDWLLHAKDSLSNAVLSVPVTIFVTVGVIFFVALFLFAFKNKD